MKRLVQGTLPRAASVVMASLLLVACGGKGAASAGAAAPAGPGSVPPPAGGNLLKASTFEDGRALPWMASFSAPAAGEAKVDNGAYCIDIENAGTNRWDAQVRHREMVIQNGHTYTVQFRAWASLETKMYPKIGMSGPPYAEYFGKLITVGTTPQVYQAQFKVDKADDPTAEFAFHVGGGLAKAVPLKVCFDDLYLTDTQFTPPPPEAAVVLPGVRVNQQGYLPSQVKIATLVSDSPNPVKWELVDAGGKSVASGDTKVKGADAHSGDNVHLIDFSSVTSRGKGYVLKAGDASSDPFDIEPSIYSALRIDSLNYFYQNRSGIEIKMPYARQEQWARPAGHLPDKATCAPEPLLKKGGWYAGGGCTYTLDVTGGWYDAGDQGKYVVNGGIAVWTMLNQYERAKAMGGDLKAIGDKKLNIPESGNNVPDLLDEARWELEFLLKMQAPEGDKAGMVHHKMHDEHWTALGLPPDKDTETRYLRPVTTAATLNLAAVAAQGARIWKTIDPKFSAKCLAAAEKAWTMALKFPELYAPADSADGGGPYDDKFLKDEFYWAAAELFVTTGKKEYYDSLVANPQNKDLLNGDGKESILTWKETDAAGAITLALVPSKLKKEEVEAQRARLIAAADKYVAAGEQEGYGIPMAPKGEGYPWGSNSFALNNMMVMALAADFTKDKKYTAAIVQGMDYLLGRNAMGQSYITGYGERPLKNPHHRFWAHQAAAAFPSAPPGIVSGGPNSGLEDPYVKAAGLAGCKPQKCYIDNIEAWSANEITINWNTPLAWVAAYLDELK
ncbi:MAG TPA: glycoside hydrolase family 9 protein [Polyangiaceae bacterium]|nr:glycoside hydrolase family 9 protein [Polyangiaceae bacterium]